MNTKISNAYGNKKIKKIRQKVIYRGRCPWRKQTIRQYVKRANSHVWRLRYAMSACLALETAMLACQIQWADGIRFRVLDLQREFQIEWVKPPKSAAEGPQELYGVRICPAEWEIQFYHRQEFYQEGFSPDTGGDSGGSYNSSRKE